MTVMVMDTRTLGTTALIFPTALSWTQTTTGSGTTATTTTIMMGSLTRKVVWGPITVVSFLIPTRKTLMVMNVSYYCYCACRHDCIYECVIEMLPRGCQ